MANACIVAWDIKHRRTSERNGTILYGGSASKPQGLALKSHPEGPKERPCSKHGPSVLATSIVLGSLPSVALSLGIVIILDNASYFKEKIVTYLVIKIFFKRIDHIVIKLFECFIIKLFTDFQFITQ
jgi:hypothetical protein